jgi:O-antigen/teichoic acid export membrane protein
VYEIRRPYPSGFVHSLAALDIGDSLLMEFSVRQSLAWMMLSQGGLFLLQFGGSVAMARLLTPYEVGIYAVSSAIVGVLSAIRATGLNVFLIREPDLKPEALATSFTINAILAMVTAAAITALGSAGGTVLGDTGVQHVLLLLALSPLFGIFELLPAASLERIGAFRVLALINLVKVTVSTTVTISLALHGFSYMSIAWGSLANTLCGVICLNILGRRYVSLRLGLKDWRRVTRFGLQMFAAGVVGNLATKLSDLLLGRLVGVSELGLYSRASGLNGLLWENVHLIIARVVFVDFSARRRRSMPLRESYLKIVAMITALFWPAFAGMAVLAGPVILNIYGPAWTDAAVLLSLLSLSALIMTSVTMAGEIYVVSGKTGLFFRYELKRTCTGLTLFALGCMGGLPWAAASRIGDALAVVLLCKNDLHRMTRTRTSDFVPIYFQSGVLTIVGCTPAALLMIVNHWSVYTPLSAILVAVVLGVAAWILGLWLLRHVLLIEAGNACRHIPRLWRFGSRGRVANVVANTKP